MYKMNRIMNPLKGIDTSFQHYVAKKKNTEDGHMRNGVPDYAFGLDYELRNKLMQIPHFYAISKAVTESQVAQRIQVMNQQALAVGPNQFPNIYQMGVDCARRLGIGVPNIYVQNNTEMNAYTVAADDASPMVVLYSGIVERMTDSELKWVIGHECGHIHNNHSVLKTVISALLSSGTGNIGLALSMANIALMQMWTRAGEVTADRAGLICADDPEDAHRVMEKLLYGGIMGKEYEVNYKALKKQLEMTLKNPTKIQEVLSNHPSEQRRLFAEMAFEECETFYSWRPELKRPGLTLYSQKETDEKCRKLVNILDNK